MPAFREVFWNDRSAPGAYLACVPGVNQYHPPTGFFRLVCEDAEKIPPTCIGDTLGKTVVLDHVLDMKTFCYDCAVFVDEFARQLVVKVAADVSHLQMFSVQERGSLPAPAAALLPTGYLLLGFNQARFGLPQKAGVVNELTIGGRQKRLQPHIDANDVGTWNKRHAFRVTREYGVPLARLSFQGECFDLAGDRPVQLDFERAYLREDKPVFCQPETRLGICEAVIAVETLETGIPGLTKRGPVVESLECLIYAMNDVLKNLGIDFVVFRTFLFHPGEFTALLFERYRDPALFPSITTLLKGGIVQFPTTVQGTGQDILLDLCRIKPVFETLTHLSPLLSLNVLSDGLIRDVTCRGHEITVCPQGGQLQERREFTPEIERTPPFESLYQFVYCHLRRARDEQMQVVWLYLQRQHLNFLFFSYTSDNGVQSLFNVPHKHLPSSLRAPDEMIVDEVDLVCRMFVFHMCLQHSIYRQISQVFEKEDALIHPQL